MLLYHIASITKIILGAVILFITYTVINIYQDPVIAIAMAFIGIFVFARGISFYFFLGIQRIYRSHIDNQERLMKDSYKLSLLFGMFCLINVGLIVRGNRNIVVGLVLIIGFIALQRKVFSSSNKDTHEE